MMYSPINYSTVLGKGDANISNWLIQEKELFLFCFFLCVFFVSALNYFPI